jgi:UDPglucose--hexose-1-phosphate uridylyltransferase
VVEFRRERLSFEILDPREGFERRRFPLEIRFDPLTGQSARLLPAGSLPPPAAIDLDRIAAATREGCPFCSGRVESETPRFPPEVVPEGRIRRGEAVLFPNLVGYAKWSSVSVYSPARHVVPLEDMSPGLMADNLATQVEFARAIVAHDPASSWISINANQLPPSGSSIFHPHLQGAANPFPTTVQRLLAGIEPRQFHDYAAAERGAADRLLGSTGRIDWFAAFAPIGSGEVRALLFDASSPEQLDDALIAELGRGLSLVLGVYAELGYQSFNLAIFGASGSSGFPLTVRVVARAYYGPLQRSDAMWSERLHWEAAVDLAPEALADTGRRHFTAAG